MIKGQLKSWDDAKGFGFIKSDEYERDVFIHISTLKAMSRKPKLGDFIYFEIERQHDGRTCAINCRIEGVAPAKKIHSKNKIRKKSPLSTIGSALFVICVGSFAYAKITSQVKPTLAFPTHEPNIQIEHETPIHNFKCDGRQYCSQMNSRAEAEFFNQYCPNTKMDGDHDGEPCESDSRF